MNPDQKPVKPMKAGLKGEADDPVVALGFVGAGLRSTKTARQTAPRGSEAAAGGGEKFGVEPRPVPP